MKKTNPIIIGILGLGITLLAVSGVWNFIDKDYDSGFLFIGIALIATATLIDLIQRNRAA